MAPGVREFIEAASPKAIAALLVRYTAILADRQQRGGDTDPIPLRRKVMITPADANLRHIGYVFGKPIFSRVNEPGDALSSQPEQS